MTTQTGVVVTAPGRPFRISHSIPRPRPGPGQVLVKTEVVHLNGTDIDMQKSGMLIREWPAVLGCDAVGVVVECGPGCGSRLRVGDRVYGFLSRLGDNEYQSFQETFLMDEDLAFRAAPGSTISPEALSTIGVGLGTAALGYFAGFDLKIPTPGKPVEQRDEWILVLGGSGSVGQAGVQLGRLCGFKVLASCAASRTSNVLAFGATATMDSRSGVAHQLAEIRRITGGNFARVIDCSAYNQELAVRALLTVSAAPRKYFATVDDWRHASAPAPIRQYRIMLDQIGRYSNPAAAKLSRQLSEWIPLLEQHVENGAIRGQDYELVGTGWEALVRGLEKQIRVGQPEKRLVVRIE